MRTRKVGLYPGYIAEQIGTNERFPDYYSKSLAEMHGHVVKAA